MQRAFVCIFLTFLFCNHISATGFVAHSFVANKANTIKKQLKAKCLIAKSDINDTKKSNDLEQFIESINANEIDASSYKIYKQAVYAFYLNKPLAVAKNDNLAKIKELTIPVKISDTFYYISMPQDGMYIALEKLTDKNITAWQEYARNEHDPYTKQNVAKTKNGLNSFIGNDQQNGFLFFLNSLEGLNYFKGRLDSGINSEYDKWIAYVTHLHPLQIAKKREATQQIDIDDLDMVMSVQAKKGLDVYSPMGISRTVECAKKLYKNSLDGIKEPKLKHGLSIWLHALTARIIKSIYKDVAFFVTAPAPSMRAIIAQAIFPHIGLPLSPRDNVKKLTKEQEKAIASKIHGECNISDSMPWRYEVEFNKPKSITTIRIEDITCMVFP